MAESKVFTLSDVAEHNTKKDLWMVVHDKVYDCSSFVDEHPGGEEVMLDVGGQDATDAFEDVGHSDEAREILKGMLQGDLKRAPGEASNKTSSSLPTGKPKAADSGLGSVGLYATLLIGGAVAYWAYLFFDQKEKSAQ